MKSPNTPQRLRLLALGLLTAAMAAVTGPALAAPAVLPPPTRGGHETTQRCYSDVAPSRYDRITNHARQRMSERGISEDELANGVRIGARSATCQQNGNWRYTLGMANGQLTVIIGLGEGGWNVITVFWKGESD
ncbi:DUF4258 domain-containing protein [Streptomyces sp. CA-181903]|uniref:DUF4258 domain-containing protein n=1 Tax=Streptomyces sp. CA-181903 TaxID=3240055 RepID=UPI003D8F0413